MNENYSDIRRMLGDVAEFHRHMGFFPFAANAPDREAVNAKRIKLITEESKELNKEIKSGDRAKRLHEAIDALYVVLGALVEDEITDAELSVGWSLVHQANMTKEAPGDPLGKGIKGPDFKPADVSIALGAAGEDRRYAVVSGGKLSFISNIGPMTRNDFLRLCMHTEENTQAMPSLIWELAA